VVDEERQENDLVADFVMATLDWGNEDKLLDGCPQLLPT